MKILFIFRVVLMCIQKHRAVIGLYASKYWSPTWRPGSTGQANFKSTLKSQHGRSVNFRCLHFPLLFKLMTIIFAGCFLINRQASIHTNDDFTGPILSHWLELGAGINDPTRIKMHQTQVYKTINMFSV